MNNAKWISSSLLVAGQLLTLAHAAFGAPLSFIPDSGAKPGAISCQVTVARVGALSLKDGSLTVKNNSATVKGAPDGYAEPRDLLAGAVLKVEADTDSIPSKITGLVYFQSGESLAAIDMPDTDDVIFRREGSVSGRVVSINPSRLTLVRKDGSRIDIDSAAVKYVRSPRAFVFVIPIAGGGTLPNAAAFASEATAAELKPTVAQRSLPLSSILPDALKKKRSAIDTAGDGSSDKDSILPEEEDDDPFTPVFKWQQGGIRRFP